MSTDPQVAFDAEDDRSRLLYLAGLAEEWEAARQEPKRLAGNPALRKQLRAAHDRAEALWYRLLDCLRALRRSAATAGMVAAQGPPPATEPPRPTVVKELADGSRVLDCPPRRWGPADLAGDLLLDEGPAAAWASWQASTAAVGLTLGQALDAADGTFFVDHYSCRQARLAAALASSPAAGLGVPPELAYPISVALDAVITAGRYDAGAAPAPAVPPPIRVSEEEQARAAKRRESAKKGVGTSRRRARKQNAAAAAGVEELICWNVFDAGRPEEPALGQVLASRHGALAKARKDFLDCPVERIVVQDLAKGAKLLSPSASERAKEILGPSPLEQFRAHDAAAKAARAQAEAQAGIPKKRRAKARKE